METTKEYFDRVAVPFNNNYVERDAFRERRRLWERLVRENLPRAAAESLCMDMGCGDGTLGQVAAASGARTIGIDQSEGMLTLARARARERGLSGQMNYVSAPLPLPPSFVDEYQGRADLILCSSVIEYIESYEEVLRQFQQLLRAGGRLIVSVPNGYSLYRWGEKALGQLHLQRDSYLRHQRHSFFPDDFKALMGDLGYLALHEEYFALPLHPLTSKLVGQRRGRRLSMLYLLVAEKPAAPL
jgi:2-polyprenyl-3-methyl-5-hydroxy-6-metoxy-1,4-benzoquinol methylase